MTPGARRMQIEVFSRKNKVDIAYISGRKKKLLQQEQ